jgi:hypothetical protein
MVVRWCYAQLDKRHKGAGCADTSRDQARRAVEELLKILGGDLWAPAPRTITDDPGWIVAVEALSTVGDHSVRISIACWLVRLDLCTRSDKVQANGERLLIAMRLCAESMIAEADACERGWSPTTGWPEGKGKRKRKRKKKRS